MRKRACISIALFLGLLTSQAMGDYHAGLGAYLSGDYATAFKELRPLAEHGEAKAQYFLGAMFLNGLGVPQDHKEAVKWLRMAAAQGHPGARFLIGVLYRSGEGVVQDYQESAKWFRMAAEQGLAIAQFSIGTLYH